MRHSAGSPFYCGLIAGIDINGHDAHFIKSLAPNIPSFGVILISDTENCI